MSGRRQEILAWVQEAKRKTDAGAALFYDDQLITDPVWEIGSEIRLRVNDNMAIVLYAPYEENLPVEDLTKRTKFLFDGPKMIDWLWGALREECCATKPPTKAKTIVMLRKADLAAVLKRGI